MFLFWWILPVKSRATNHENSRGSPSIAAAILLRWWRMMARSKAYDPLRQSVWSAADRAANYVVDRPSRWRLRIFVEIRRRQRDGVERHHIDGSATSSLHDY